MASPYMIPGSFPTDLNQASEPVTNDSESPFSYQIDPDLSVDDALQASFASKELGAARTLAQKHLIGQLDTLTYFTIGFQFLRYTHGSCMPPTLAHLFVQFSLYARQFTSAGPESGRQIFAEHLTSQEQHFQAAGLSFDRRRIINFVVSKTRNVILWKFVACAVYHTFLVVFYFQRLANEERLHLLGNGSWYFVSFVGEEFVPAHLSSGSYWLRLWQLGLFGLLATDVLILVLQLVLYQGIFLQSTISPKGLRLNEAERYILRAQGAGSGEGLETTSSGIPSVLHVKLYESLGENPITDISAE